MDPIEANVVLHGSCLEGTFFVWGEGIVAEADRSVAFDPPAHPHAVPAARLRIELARRVTLGEWTGQAPDAAAVILLPSTEDGPCLPAWLAPEGEGQPQTGQHLAPWSVPGLAIDLLDALDLLLAVPAGEGTDGRWGSDLRYWSLAAKLGLEWLAGHKYLPGLEARNGAYHALWLPLTDDPTDRQRLRRLAEAMPPACRALVRAPLLADTTGQSPLGEHASAPHVLLDQFLKHLTDRAVRAWGREFLDRRRKAPVGAAGAWWAALWREGQAGEGAEIGVPVVVSPGTQRELAELYDAWRGWIGQLHPAAQAAFRLCFRLEPPAIDVASGRVVGSTWTLRYLLQANDDLSLLVPVDEAWRARDDVLHVLDRHFAGAQEHVLAGLGLAARLFPPIMHSLRAACPVDCPLTVDEAYAFLREVGPLLEGSGFGVLIPPWWNKPGARLGVRARLQGDASAVSRGILNMDALVAFDWELVLGGQPLSREELEHLAALKMPLVQVRGQWVMLRQDEIEAAIAFWEKKRRRAEMPLGEALNVALGATDALGGLPLEGVETSGWLNELLGQMAAGEHVTPLPPPAGLSGELRPYQVRGYSWLAFLRRWGMGACLADDMGLGKTIQAIALLLRERDGRGAAAVPIPGSEEGASEDAPPGPALVICPTSVVGNWRREIARFAPGLRVLVHHGGERARGEAFAAAAQAHDVVISTYGLARRDIDDLRQVPWSDVILDEAQNIKNPHSRQAQAIRTLPAANRIALTGTPVENRLSELWSIMQFLNPGYLGSQNRFRQSFALPIERYRDPQAAEKLKGLVQPFVLRRVKTDPTIIQDLPEKFEMKVYCNLETEQATLYQAVVQEALARVEAAAQEGIERRGVVLGMLTRLKQVCNHPAQFLADGSPLPGRSGKLERLGEMLEEALSVGDRALVFTQFAEMGQLLQAHLRARFGTEVLFLHGGTPQPQRERMIGRFQGPGGPPIFVLSLKAGGTGLNLTAANHVFHFDRWWNPAVEDQATDRAFRIGQTRDVQVHKLICVGTLEERIDELIESKKALADSVIGAGEAWLTELSTDELRDLITLRQE